MAMHSIFKFRQPYIINYIFQKVLRINASAIFSVHYTSQVINGEKIVIGDGVSKYTANAIGCYYHGINGIEIGDNTIIAAGVRIISTSHCKGDYKKLLIGSQYKIKIGSNCWLGTNCVIMPGVTLGDNVIVGAGAVVTKSFDSGCTIMGAPAEKHVPGIKR